MLDQHLLVWILSGQHTIAAVSLRMRVPSYGSLEGVAVLSTSKIYVSAVIKQQLHYAVLPSNAAASRALRYPPL